MKKKILLIYKSDEEISGWCSGIASDYNVKVPGSILSTFFGFLFGKILGFIQSKNTCQNRLGNMGPSLERGLMGTSVHVRAVQDGINCWAVYYYDCSS